MYSENMIKKSTLHPADITALIGAMKVVFPTREEVEQMIDEKLDQKLDQKLGRLPTKEEFSSRMDQLAGEYKKIDEAETLHAGNISEHADTLENHEDRIKVLEHRRESTPSPVSTNL